MLSLTHPVGQSGLEESIKESFCPYFTKDKFSRLSRVIVPLVDGTGNSRALKILLFDFNMLSGMT